MNSTSNPENIPEKLDEPTNGTEWGRKRDERSPRDLREPVNIVLYKYTTNRNNILKKKKSTCDRSRDVNKFDSVSHVVESSYINIFSKIFLNYMMPTRDI